MNENYESEFISVLEKHAPIKTRKPRNKPLPCMNSEFRSAIHKKHMLYFYFTKNKNAKTWDKYRRQRNYFLERCTGGCENSKYLVHNETFSLKKCYGGEQKIVLCENDKIVNNIKDVTECFNNFFSTVANSIGKDVNHDPLQHPRIVEIKRKMEIKSEKSFVFKKLTEQKVEKI